MSTGISTDPADIHRRSVDILRYSRVIHNWGPIEFSSGDNSVDKSVDKFFGNKVIHSLWTTLCITLRVGVCFASLTPHP